MENNIAEQMENLKKELRKKKDEIQDLKELVKTDIDRDFPSNPKDFSARELESQMDEYHSLLDRYVDPMPDKTSFTSHRKRIGMPIVWIKRILLKMTRPYISIILERQKIFNQKCMDLYQNLILHQKKYHDKISRVEERIGEFEVHLEVLQKKLEKISPNGEQQGIQSSPDRTEKENT
jgi:predicted  nucleic acid-binding Zn-ribbon protein